MATNGMDSLNNNKPPRKPKSNPIIYKNEKPAMSTGRDSYRVSENVTVKAKKGTPGLSSSSLKGAAQAVRQNVKAATPPSKKEIKANARGLKAANGPKPPSDLSKKIAKKVFTANVLKKGKK